MIIKQYLVGDRLSVGTYNVIGFVLLILHDFASYYVKAKLLFLCFIFIEYHDVTTIETQRT